MKTKIFTRYGLGQEDQEKITFLQEVEANLYTFILGEFAKRKTLSSLTDGEIREMVTKTNVPTDIFLKSLKDVFWVLIFLSRNYKDNVLDLIDDIVLLYPDCIKNKELLTERLSSLSKVSSDYVLLTKIEDVKSDGLPELKNTSTSVIIKPVFDERFDFDNSSIKDYKPNRVKKVTCAVIEFKNSYNKFFSFQVDSSDLEKLINDLIALQIELKSFEDECR